MKSIFVALLCTVSLYSFSQTEKNPYPKFGKISIEELQKKVYAIDSNANAVVLTDVGSSAVEGNYKGWFSLSSKRHTIIHILNKNAYDEASIEIPLYVDGRDEEKVINLKAVTYNLENGKVTQAKLEKSSQFIEKVDKNRNIFNPHCSKTSLKC